MSTNLIAQTPYTGYIPFPEDSAQWSVGYQDQTSISSVQYKMKGDTIINGISYNKIYKGYDLNYSAPDTVLNCFIRQDTANKKVYCRYPYAAYQDSSEFLLYDFNLTTGDTFNLKILPNHITYPLVIVGVDTAQFNSDFRRILYAHVVDTCMQSHCLWGIGMDIELWTEGMGSGHHLFYCEIPKDCCDSSSYNEQCFWQNGHYVSGGGFCDFSTIIKEKNSSETEIFSVFPVPIIETSVIELKSRGCFLIEIYTTLGVKIKSIETSEGQVRFYTDDFALGLYLIKVTNKSKEESEIKKIAVLLK